MIKTNCKNCNAEILVHICHYKRGRGRFCSRVCGGKYNMKYNEKLKEARKAWGKSIKPSRSKKPTKQCIFCGTSFIGYSIRKFCGKSCAAKSRIPELLASRKPWSEERRKRQSETMLKIGKKPPVKKGSDNHRWKGGITSDSDKIRRSQIYKNWKKSIYERDNNSCVDCGSKENIELHHIKPFSLFPELRMTDENAKILCKSCHVKTDSYGWKFYNKNFKDYKKHGEQNTERAKARKLSKQSEIFNN